MATLAGLALATALAFNPYGQPLISSVGFGVACSCAVVHLIPQAGPALIRAGLKGRDRLKTSGQEIPETLGAVVGAVYLLAMLLFIPFMFYKYFVTPQGGATRDPSVDVNANPDRFPHSMLAEYLSALLSLQAMLMLGVADDLFDLRWRHKFFLPAIAAIPMLIIYYVDFGETHITLPPILGLGTIIDLGWLYYAYMGAFAIFCTNCINIYAGVNGLEVGQSVVMAGCVLLNDALYIFALPHTHPAVHNHLLSAYILIPFTLASLPLLKYNWWPARGFVGDTYCYFAGMVFAVVGILGHFSKTLLSLFGPQVFNFVYSMPQLFHLVPCPRHRMPVLDENGKLLPSRADVTACHPVIKWPLKLLAKFGLIGMWEDKDKLEVSNMTLISLTLVWTGPIREDQLTIVLLAMQGAWGVFAVLARHWLARIVFGHDNL